MSQNNAIKLHVSTATAHNLRQAALRRGTSVADVVRRLVETHLDVPRPDSDCVVETNRSGGRVSAAYLSNALADAVRDLAAQSGASVTWTIRNLLRSELKRRGLLPSPSPADSTAI